MHNFFDVLVWPLLWIIKLFCLGMNPSSKLSDARELIHRTCVPDPETGGLLLRFLIEVLSVERMHFQVVLTLCDVESVVPVMFERFQLTRVSMGFSSLKFPFSRCLWPLFGRNLEILFLLLPLTCLFLYHCWHWLDRFDLLLVLGGR